MDPVRNPYAPGAGRVPAALAGRDAQLDAWRVGLERIERGRDSQPHALYGLRGVGKTVLLSEFAATARARDWIVAQVEGGAGASLRSTLGEALHAPMADRARLSAGERLRAALKTMLSFKASYDTSGVWSFGLDLEAARGGGADTGVLETDLVKVVADVSAAAREEGVGLAIVVDETQELTSEELAALCALAHVGGQRGWALAFAVAGLPSLPRVLAEAKSYAERLFVYSPIGHLDELAAVTALRAPAEAEGVAWDPAGLAHVVAAAAGYPYFLQQFGQDTWHAADGPTLTLADARVGAAVGLHALDNGFFRARWDRATPAEQAYLRAMAAEGGRSANSGAVATRLGRPASSLGPARANLIAKGLVYAPEHGAVAFTVPGMAEFIARQPEG
ncbi:MAG: ATP-binding protein [Sporichthyaceae bacterium]